MGLNMKYLSILLMLLMVGCNVTTSSLTTLQLPEGETFLDYDHSTSDHAIITTRDEKGAIKLYIYRNHNLDLKLVIFEREDDGNN